MTSNDYRVPVSDEMRATLNELARLVGGRIPPCWGFTLLLFDYGDAPNRSMLYISSAQRADMVRAMQEFVAKQANA